MKKENLLIIILVTTFITLVNYFTDFMFAVNIEILIFMWIIFNTIFFPIWMGNYFYNLSKEKNSKQILSSLIVLVAYLATYVIPSLGYINFTTFSLNGDGASKAIMKGILLFGLFVTFIVLIVLNLKLKSEYQKSSRIE
jgi:hypothetical protein